MMEKNRVTRALVSDKHYPLSIEMRPLWRMCLILVSIIVVSGEKKYLDNKKVNILVWMLIRRAKWDEYEDYLFERCHKIPLVSIDTATYKALELLLSKDCVALDDGKIFVTETGEILYRAVIEQGVMGDEIAFLDRLGRKLTEEKVKGLTGK